MINKSRKLDQFYTKPEVAKYFYKKLSSIVNIDDSFLLEPSAGEGSFSILFHSNSLALDLDPKRDNIKKQDFLEFNSSNQIKTDKPIVVIGNPPFGKNASLAVSFFNKSADFSNVIAFIIPKTFKKESVTNRLSLDFHLEYSEDVQKDSFTFNNEDYDVPCVFQIWIRRNTKRKKIIRKKTTNLFNFTTKSDADLAIRRVGGLAGKVFSDNFNKYEPPSHYYLKITSKPKKELVELLQSKYEKLQDAARNTAGNPSLSKSELIAIIEE